METMKDFEKELEASYELMGDGENDTDTILAWNKIEEMFEAQEVLTVEICGVVNKGVIAMVEEQRAFIPASRLSLEHVEDLNEWLGKTIKVRIITADRANNKLVLSARELLREERAAAKQLKIDSITEGSVFTGTVESLKDYGAFVNLGDGITGLVHISEISFDRIKHPGVCLEVGQEVQVKVIGKKDGKLKLSIKALLEKVEEEVVEVEIPEAEEIGTSMADLLKNWKF